MKRHSEVLIRLLRRQLRHPRTGAEVGVWRGENAVALMEAFPRLKLLAVDIWAPLPQTIRRWRKHNMGDETVFQAIHHEAITGTRPFSHRCALVQSSSSMAARFVTSCSLDFVFIDACHEYSYVATDLKHWWPNVRLGGIICGHDYGGAGDRKGLFGVRKAVQQFLGGAPQVLRGRIWWHKKMDHDPVRSRGKLFGTHVP